MSKLLKRFNELKEKDNNKIYIFKVGIFYNLLNEDARLVSDKIGLKLTDLSPEIIKCGFPIASLQKYTSKFDELQIPYKVIDDTPKGINPNIYYKITNELKNIDINNLTGVDAINILNKIKQELK